jgi:putative SOS response-associated peptidase YedK
MSFSLQVEQDLKTLAHRFNAEINEKAFDNLKMLEANEPNRYRYVFDEDHRIYKEIWAPVICLVKGKREIRPMRYSLLPHFNKEEDKAKVLVDAELSNLETEKEWAKPFMKFHALLPIKKFYEWVPKNGHKSMISFFPKNDEYILVPCLYDNWFSTDKKKIIQSFALISDSARSEVKELGHDKTPIALDETKINAWLTPENYDKSVIYDILNTPRHDQYDHQWMM